MTEHVKNERENKEKREEIEVAQTQRDNLRAKKKRAEFDLKDIQLSIDETLNDIKRI